MATIAYIAMGANLGDREKNLRDALANLEYADGINVCKVSTFIENPAVGGPADSPPFFNAAVEILTSLSAPQLLKTMLAIETDMGRVRGEKWGPRPIDLDLLFYGEQILTQPGLTVPHPHIHQRIFVLRPLMQIAPEFVHPILKRNIADLLADLEKVSH